VRRRTSEGRHTPGGRLAASLAGLVLVVVACGPAAAPTPSPTGTATPSPTAAETASPTPTVEPTVSPTPTTGATECESTGPTNASAGWTELEGEEGDYRFSHPSEWVSAGQDIPANSSVSPDTFEETGLADDDTHHVDLVRSIDGSVGVSAWVIPGVSTESQELFIRELAWLSTQPQLTTLLDDDLRECFDGTRAYGFSSTWELTSGETSIVIFVMQRNGKMYEVQLTTTDQAQELTFMELIRTWKWTEPGETPTPTPGGGGDIEDQLASTDFKVAGMAAELIDEEGQEHPDQSSFEDTFPARSGNIYVVYELDDGVADTVEFTWRRGDRDLFSNSFNYTERTTFAWAWITPPSSGVFQTGDYAVTLTLRDSGDSITLPFTIE
jgi:hypothetical protein